MRDHRPHIVEETCTGCGVCHFVCPAPENAVIIMPLAERPPRPFADLNQADLTDDDVRQLFHDIERHAEPLQATIKGGGPVTLSEAQCWAGAMMMN